MSAGSAARSVTSPTLLVCPPPCPPEPVVEDTLLAPAVPALLVAAPPMPPPVLVATPVPELLACVPPVPVLVPPVPVVDALEVVLEPAAPPLDELLPLLLELHAAAMETTRTQPEKRTARIRCLRARRGARGYDAPQ